MPSVSSSHYHSGNVASPRSGLPSSGHPGPWFFQVRNIQGRPTMKHSHTKQMLVVSQKSPSFPKKKSVTNILQRFHGLVSLLKKKQWKPNTFPTLPGSSTIALPPLAHEMTPVVPSFQWAPGQQALPAMTRGTLSWINWQGFHPIPVGMIWEFLFNHEDFMG